MRSVEHIFRSIRFSFYCVNIFTTCSLFVFPVIIIIIIVVVVVIVILITIIIPVSKVGHLF
jgi:hypothetical protein